MGERAKQRKLQQWNKEDERAKQAALRELLRTSQGRKLMLSWLELSKALGSNPFTGNALTTSFGCGEQNVGQQLLAQVLEVDADAFLTMLKEREDERTARDAALARRDEERGDGDDRDREDGGDEHFSDGED